MGLGAYTMGVLVTRADWSFWIAWPAGALLAAGVGTLVALPALRLRGLYLAIITISFVLIVHWSFLHARFITGGATGFSVPHPNYFGLPLPNTLATYYLSLLTLLGAMWIVRNLVASGFGRALLCLAEQELVAPALGINVYRTKIAVFRAERPPRRIRGGAARDHPPVHRPAELLAPPARGPALHGRARGASRASSARCSEPRS